MIECNDSRESQMTQISPIGWGALLLSTSPGFVITTEYQSQTLEKC